MSSTPNLDPVVESIVSAAGSKPAPKKDQVRGSKKNSKGSASGEKKVNFSKSTENSLSAKVEEHNKKATKGRKATLAMLKAVYRRGAGAYSVSHRPGMTRNQWAMARVNAFLKLLKSGKPTHSTYKSDNDLLPSAHPKSSKKLKSLKASAALVPEEADLAGALLEIATKYGKFNEDETGIWAGYVPAAENNVNQIGVNCRNCVLYAGEGQCQILAMPVEEEGRCRFAVIPDGVVDVGVLEGEKQNYKMATPELIEDIEHEYTIDRELSIKIGQETDYDSPEQAILALTEFSGFGYEAEHSIRASWLRAVRNGENPFVRASLLASFGRKSVDADLLPRDEDY
jgi:hypothetical protein